MPAEVESTAAEGPAHLVRVSPVSSSSMHLHFVEKLCGLCRRAEHRGMRAHQQKAAYRRHMCHGRVRERERESLVPEYERVVALARGDRESSFIRRRAVLGHSIVDRSTRCKFTCLFVRDAVFRCIVRQVC